jgi:hypothetical protein
MTKPDNIVAYIGRSRSRVHEQMPLHLIHTNCPMTEKIFRLLDGSVGYEHSRVSIGMAIYSRPSRNNVIVITVPADSDSLIISRKTIYNCLGSEFETYFLRAEAVTDGRR